MTADRTVNQLGTELHTAYLAKVEAYVKLYLKPRPRYMPERLYRWLMSWVVLYESMPKVAGLVERARSDAHYLREEHWPSEAETIDLLVARLADAEKVVGAARDKLALLKYPDGTGGHDETVCAAVYHPKGLCTCGTDQLAAALDGYDHTAACRTDGHKSNG